MPTRFAAALGACFLLASCHFDNSALTDVPDVVPDTQAELDSSADDVLDTTPDTIDRDTATDTGADADGGACDPGETLCGQLCVNLETSPVHCGGCGQRCTDPPSCQEGECVCPDGYVDCGDGCVNLQTSDEHCGRCDRACGEHDECTAGYCTCAPPRTTCGDECVDTHIDARHCGACDAACDPGFVCQTSRCEDTCGDDETFCDPECVDLSANPDHCGACDEACRADELCVDGTCVCPTGTAACGGVCADLNTSGLHCGGCDIACPPGATCADGICACDAGLEACGASPLVCVDLSSDDAHCGGCDQICPDGATCESSLCGCPDDERICDIDGVDVCVDVMANVAHCGGCAAPCGFMQTCEAGVCEGGCDGTRCGDACIDTDTDPLHCGDCDQVCLADAPCADGLCGCPPDDVAEPNPSDAPTPLAAGVRTVPPSLNLCGTDVDAFRVPLLGATTVVEIAFVGDCADADLTLEATHVEAGVTTTSTPDEGCPSLLVRTETEDATVAVGATGGTAGHYGLSVARWQVEELEPNDSYATATGPLAYSGLLRGHLDGEEQDYWSLSLPYWADSVQATVGASATGGCNAPATLTLETESEPDPLATAITGRTLCALLTYEHLAPGEYALAVTGTDASESGLYALNVVIDVPTEEEPNDAAATQVFTAPASVMGGLVPGGDIDQIGWQLSAGETLVRVDAPLGDCDAAIDIAVFDDEGEALAPTDPGLADACRAVTVTAPSAGTYTVALTGAAQPYVLSVATP